MQSAPLYQDVADGPEGGVAHWLTTSDGLRIRAGLWGQNGAKGTVLLFPGRTEYIEKYGRTAREFAAGGYATLVIDWRGQGLADRMHDDRGMGHVMRFVDYQHDIDALMDHARALGLPEPFHLVAHSMGGCIALRAAHQGMDVRSIMFSAPMWGIGMSRPLRPFAWGVSTLSRYFGFSNRISPGQSTTSYLTRTTLEQNELTHDAEMFDYMHHQLEVHPDLGLGGPSLRWLHESLVEMRDLAALPSPNVPALTYLGSDETIVDPQRIRDRMPIWDNGTLREIEGGKHEMLLEVSSIRNQVHAETLAFFDAHSQGSAKADDSDVA